MRKIKFKIKPHTRRIIIFIGLLLKKEFKLFLVFSGICVVCLLGFLPIYKSGMTVYADIYFFFLAPAIFGLFLFFFHILFKLIDILYLKHNWYKAGQIERHIRRKHD